MRLAIAVLLSSACILAAHATDLTTRDGAIYRNYRVVASDPGYVTILYNDGGGRVPLAQLPADLQREYHYDPATAAAYTRQFEAEDRHERVAVQLAQSPSLALPPIDASPDATMSAAVPPSSAPAPSDIPAAAAPVASSAPDSASADSSGLDLGVDPLQPNSSVLSQNSLTFDSGSSYGSSYQTPDDYSYYAAYDHSGGLWVSSYDREGRLHWYRWDRKFDHRRDGVVRLDGCRDLPPNALVTLDRSGQWVITYVDSRGSAQRFYRSTAQLHADPAKGAWRVVVSDDGSRSLRREYETPNPPQDFHRYAFVDQGLTHENHASTFHGLAGYARPGSGNLHAGTSYSTSIVTGGNVRTGIVSGQMGTG